MSIAQLYVSEIHEKIGLFATWMPNTRLQVGHYGTVLGALFQPMNRLEELKTETSSGTASYDFTINATRRINTDSQALAEFGLSTGKALLEVSFQKEAGVTFSALETQVIRVKNNVALGEKLIEMQSEGKWDMKHAIIVEIITAARATIIASDHSGAEVKFAVDAKTPIDPTTMVNLNARASLLMEKGAGVKVIGEGPLSPLFRLAFLRSRWLRNPEIAYRGPSGEETQATRVDVSEEHYLEIY